MAGASASAVVCMRGYCCCCCCFGWVWRRR
eukprot:COSAG01_NODE_18739_length_1056_cov_1.077325_2_plen_29_part_01